MMESVAWPWTAAAWAALGRSELPALLSLAAWTLLAAWFGRTQFERNLRFDAVAAQATPQTNGTRRGNRPPRLSIAFPRDASATRWPPSSKRNCAPSPARPVTAWSS